MATRSRITVRKDKDTRISIYCHWDGYPSNNGALLLEHYNTKAKALKLLKHGDLSFLAPKVNPTKGVTHNFETNEEGVCVYYSRDRGDTQYCNTITLSNGESIDGEEYHYYFDGKKWTCNGELLTDKMCSS